MIVPCCSSSNTSLHPKWWVRTFGSRIHSCFRNPRMALQARFPTSDLVALLALVPPTETLSKSHSCRDFGEVCVYLFLKIKTLGPTLQKEDLLFLVFFKFLLNAHLSRRIKRAAGSLEYGKSKCWGRGNELQVYSSGCVLRKNCSALFAEAARPRDLEEDRRFLLQTNGVLDIKTPGKITWTHMDPRNDGFPISYYNLLFQKSIFRCHVSFRVCTSTKWLDKFVEACVVNSKKKRLLELSQTHQFLGPKKISGS